MDYTAVMKELRDFRDQRGWRKYHTLPALARALTVEAAEVNEIFLWQGDHSELTAEKTAELKMELADTLTYLYYMCDRLHVDPNEIVHEKLKINQKRHWTFDKQQGGQ
ncbi:nucleotide pyrophosphohydrolase [Lactobacillus sp. ZJLC3-7]|nr:nucleotide pyrophosphohydrolase [Levilactobacillus tujiorum]